MRLAIILLALVLTDLAPADPAGGTTPTPSPELTERWNRMLSLGRSGPAGQAGGPIADILSSGNTSGLLGPSAEVMRQQMLREQWGEMLTGILRERGIDANELRTSNPDLYARLTDISRLSDPLVAGDLSGVLNMVRGDLQGAGLLPTGTGPGGTGGPTGGPTGPGPGSNPGAVPPGEGPRPPAEPPAAPPVAPPAAPPVAPPSAENPASRPPASPIGIATDGGRSQDIRGTPLQSMASDSDGAGFLGRHRNDVAGAGAGDGTGASGGRTTDSSAAPTTSHDLIRNLPLPNLNPLAAARGAKGDAAVAARETQFYRDSRRDDSGAGASSAKSAESSGGRGGPGATRLDGTAARGATGGSSASGDRLVSNELGVDERRRDDGASAYRGATRESGSLVLVAPGDKLASLASKLGGGAGGAAGTLDGRGVLRIPPIAKMVSLFERLLAKLRAGEAGPPSRRALASSTPRESSRPKFRLPRFVAAALGLSTAGTDGIDDPAVGSAAAFWASQPGATTGGAAVLFSALLFGVWLRRRRSRRRQETSARP